MDKKIIEEKIEQLKIKYYDVSDRMWIQPTNGLNREAELFKLESQIQILEELLNG